MPEIRLIVGDVRDTLTRLETDGERFDLLVTSPPFLALRSYLPADHPDKHREIGSEPTPATFLDTLYGLTADWGRLLPEWASICVELGDTMSGSGGAGGDYNPDGLREGQPKADGSQRRTRTHNLYNTSNRYSDGWNIGNTAGKPIAGVPETGGPGWPLTKSMCLIPHLYTIGLAYGMNPLTGTVTPAGQWRIRNVVTWARPNPPVGSLGKRNPQKRTGDYKFRPACSYITVACRGTGRYFDLDAVRYQPDVVLNDANGNNTKGSDGSSFRFAKRINNSPAGAPPLDWHTDQLDGDWLWKLATAPYPGAHYATYPLTLPRRLILAMCPSEVCVVCGWPRERVTQPTNDYAQFMGDAFGDAEVRTMHKTETGRGIPASMRSQGRGGLTATNTTLGWTDCGCSAPCSECEGVGGTWDAGCPYPCPACDGRGGHDNYRPGHVLDPFAGSGTTAVAAALEGRDCTLIDLDPRNVDLVDRRLREALNVLSVERDGNTVTWTVEAPLPAQREQVDGQLNLLDSYG